MKQRSSIILENKIPAPGGLTKETKVRKEEKKSSPPSHHPLSLSKLNHAEEKGSQPEQEQGKILPLNEETSTMLKTGEPTRSL